MAIDWFTFFAQIVNFLVLIFVLQRWLYKPITQAMQRRENTIRDNLDSASKQQQDAQEEVERYQAMQQELETHRLDLLAQAKLETEQTRQHLLQEMHESVETERSQWQSMLQRQKESFLREVSYRTMQQLQATVRRVLADLAESELETQMARVFLQKLQNLNASERTELVKTLTVATTDVISLTLVSTFELPKDIRGAIATILQTYFDVSGKVELNYEIQSNLICGIELRGTGYKLAWSIDAYLDEIAENLVTVFTEESVTV
ncbi:F0F1 ATP synthase subunit B family protein [Lyngbya aestuarii]|uniref:F0F1 ATP synthase subunit B family protein n=1 Tax=Lyngbya aestuarii TaxID=118322 RepID=UPI00403E2F50